MTDLLFAVVEEFYGGTWIADIVTSVTPDGSFTLGGNLWAGTLTDTPRQEGGKFYSRLIGGQGKLNQTVTDRWYLGTLDADTIAKDAIAEAGEVLGSSSLGIRVASWQRLTGPLGAALDDLTAAAGGLWWIGRSGALNVGARSGVAIDPNRYSRISSDVDSAVVLNTNDSNINPGDTWLGKTIKHIRWALGANTLTAELAFRPLDLGFHQPGVDYLRHYLAKVDSQNGDGTLNVIANGRFSANSVLFLAGLPATIKVNPGDTVTLGWFGGAPNAPYCYGLQQVGTKQVARVGDTVDCGWFVFPIQGTGTGTVAIPPAQWFPPGDQGKLAAALVGIPPLYASPINVIGVVASGSDRVSLP